ncbi:hypothetical protein [Hymenobacter sp. BT491]|uniref:hypothetical protein n=1 Tax=Hymenobacter sp. BT491 TaxID=2766779 RepID=UPI0016539E7A|nr:hypothetical protein [Hymenobacter sp. BT491]MBC6990717.1 hypothetical protein [Hymenobacter sp. BT491]
MTYDQFSASLTASAPPASFSPLLRALWHAARLEWKQAHELAQENESDAAHNWLHAYLHRLEGDRSNAAYWYRRASRPVFQGTLADELREMLLAQLQKE